MSIPEEFIPTEFELDLMARAFIHTGVKNAREKINIVIETYLENIEKE